METKIKLSRLPDEEFVFNRINILLGANGTGKSKLLKELRDQAPNYFGNRTVIFVEGGRTIKLTNSLQLTRHNFQQYGTLQKANQTFQSKRKSTLSDRVMDALLLLDRMGQEIRGQHSDKVNEWQKNGQNGPMPLREEPPLTKLFTLFSEIFPSIELNLDSANKSITCTKNGSSPYPPSELSDGEKQVLSILADIAILGDDSSLILVDEPELNLNPALACRVWDTIENDLPDCVFVYTTHNVGFSMRANVDNVLVLSNTNENISEISNIGEIDGNDLRALLGSIPAILSTSNALITEGRETSFDSIFYRWLVGRTDIEIVPMGSGSDVQAVANRLGIWNAIAPSVKLMGVFDRDYKSNETIDSLTSDNCIPLLFHEAESYFCIPNVVVQITQNMGLKEAVPTAEEIENLIISEFEKLKLEIAAQRVFDRAKINLAVSIPKTELKQIDTVESLELKLIEESKSQTEYANENLDEAKIKEILKTELDFCEKAINERDIELILSLLPGKSLIAKISSISGARNPSDYARACTKHLSIDEYEPFKKLKESLKFE
ncbi:ATP-binding protein [Maribacter sp. ANRC-HE7]|uniref:ATP-binding protein n=1 Tax=Maribacter aquimaris TaxID=2737171 RepID=A0ABR7V184_9FLAO|nr:AAA family ATPase [Maribacter aquimaris]MBD0778252.1 ATP-binding protein [Maribacter aquimaris]